MSDRKIDALIAEHLMGHTVSTDYGGYYDFVESETDGRRLRNYSSSIADAWTVVEKMQRRIEIEKHTDGLVCVRIDPHTFNYEARDNSAPLAICLAALKALGVKYE